ncbi:hypothetical protein ABPG75_008739 [Micractinium tetrahymenae]
MLPPPVGSLSGRSGLSSLGAALSTQPILKPSAPQTLPPLQHSLQQSVVLLPQGSLLPRQSSGSMSLTATQLDSQQLCRSQSGHGSMPPSLESIMSLQRSRGSQRPGGEQQSPPESMAASQPPPLPPLQQHQQHQQHQQQSAMQQQQQHQQQSAMQQQQQHQQQSAMQQQQQHQQQSAMQQQQQQQSAIQHAVLQQAWQLLQLLSTLAGTGQRAQQHPSPLPPPQLPPPPLAAASHSLPPLKLPLSMQHHQQPLLPTVQLPFRLLLPQPAAPSSAAATVLSPFQQAAAATALPHLGTAPQQAAIMLALQAAMQQQQQQQQAWALLHRDQPQRVSEQQHLLLLLQQLQAAAPSVAPNLLSGLYPGATPLVPPPQP